MCWLQFSQRLQRNNFLHLRSFIVSRWLFLLWLVLLASTVDAQTLTNTPPPATPPATPRPLDWCYNFDFRVSDGGWTRSVPGTGLSFGDWVSGDGWTASNDDYFTLKVRGLGIQYLAGAVSTSMYSMTVDWTYEMGEMTSANTDDMTTGGHHPLKGAFGHINTGSYLLINKNSAAATSGVVAWVNQAFNQGVNHTNGTFYITSYASSDGTDPKLQTGNVIIHSIRYEGWGTSPFPASNCGAWGATPTPTPSSSPSPSPSPTFPPDWNILCPQSPVDPLAVSGHYQSQCQPCLQAQWGTPAPYDGEGTPTATQTPLGYLTPTDVPRVGTYEPNPTDIANPTPSPSTLSCNFTTDCDFVSLIKGEIDNPIIHADYEVSTGVFQRGVQVMITMPKTAGGSLLEVVEISVDVDMDTSGLPIDYEIRYLTSLGVAVSSSTDELGDGSHVTSHTTFPESVYYVEITIFSDEQTTIGALTGQVLLNLVTLTYLGASGGDVFDSSTIRCDIPGDYPFVVPFDISGFGYINTTCHTLIPYISLSLLQEAMEAFGFEIDGVMHIPKVEVCIDWYTLPSVTFLGILAPISMFLNVLTLVQMIKTILKF